MTTASNYLFDPEERPLSAIDGVNEIRALGKRLRMAITLAAGVKRVARTNAARDVWHGVDGKLSQGGTGLVGALKARGEAHVVRLATLYALLDQSDTIDAPHMNAGLAVWEYAEASIDYVFGDTLGDPVADTIHREVQKHADGLTLTQVSALFNRHIKAARISASVDLLIARGYVEEVEISTSGRSARRIVANAKKAN